MKSGFFLASQKSELAHAETPLTKAISLLEYLNNSSHKSLTVEEFEEIERFLTSHLAMLALAPESKMQLENCLKTIATTKEACGKNTEAQPLASDELEETIKANQAFIQEKKASIDRVEASHKNNKDTAKPNALIKQYLARQHQQIQRAEQELAASKQNLEERAACYLLNQHLQEALQAQQASLLQLLNNSSFRDSLNNLIKSWQANLALLTEQAKNATSIPATSLTFSH